MMSYFPDIPLGLYVLSCAVALGAGVVKGLVGFAMPMILISGLSSFLDPDLALAGLILPTLVSNGLQALRQGPAAAMASARKFRVFLLCGLVFLLMSAQMVAFVPVAWLLAMIGVPVCLFAAAQLMGWALSLPNGRSQRAEVMIGGLAGFIGGFSGVWGPPTVAYLTALGTEKKEQMRVQGVVYGLGAVALTFAHIGSGVFHLGVIGFSAMLVVPAVLGMSVGRRIQDRIDQAAFRKATLVVLLVAGANLVRRAIMG